MKRRFHRPALAVLLAAACMPTSMKKAVLRNPDEFPQPYAAVTPPSSDSALGREPVAGSAADHIVLSATACFASAASNAGLASMS